MFFLLFSLLTATASAQELASYSLAQISSATQVDVQSKDSLTSKVVAHIGPKDFFAVQLAGDWYMIVDGRYSGGFVPKASVRLTGAEFPVIEVTAAPARVRSNPGTDSKVVGELAKGAVLAGEHKGTWYEIKDGRFRGQFIAAELVGKPNIAKAPEEPAAPGVIPTPTPTSTPVPDPSPGPSATPDATPAPSPTPLSFLPPPPPQGTPPPEITNPITPNATVQKVDLTQTAPTPAPVAAKAPQGQAGAHQFDVAPQTWDEKTDKLYQERLDKIFKSKGKQLPAENQVLMPVYFETKDKIFGQIQTKVHGKDPLLIDAPTLFRYLHLVMIASWFDRPDIAAIDPAKASSKDPIPRQWVSIEKFFGTGINMVFNDQLLQIFISVPPILRSPTISSVFKFTDSVDDQAATDPPALFSSYLNLNASESIDTRNVTYADRRVPLKAQLENGTNIGSVVVESYGTYLENRLGAQNTVPEFTRGDVRAVKDYPAKLMRTSAGDLVYPVQGFQIYRPMAGLSVTSNFTMARSKLTYPTGNYEIFLQRNAKVYVWLNNQLQKVIDLPAGRHSLRDFPFASGSNELRLEIIDDVGRQETQTFSYFSSAELLRPELHQYSYAAGEPSSDVTNSRVYDPSNPSISAFHRYGLREDVTVGANLQYDKFQEIVGGEVLISSEVGFFKIEPAVSNGTIQGTGGAINTTYIYSDANGPKKTSRSFNLGVNHSGSSFAQFGSTLPAGTSKDYEITSGYTRGLNQNTSGNISTAISSYSGPAGVQNGFTLRIGINKRWQNGINASASISHIKSLSGSEELDLSVFLIWTFPEEKQALSLIHNTADQSSRLDWSYNPSEGTDSANYSAAVRDNLLEQGYSGQLFYDGNRARVGLSHEVILEKPGSTQNSVGGTQRTSDNVTSVLLGTAVAYAGGHFAIGRPVTDSFAIVAPIKNLKGQRLDINPNGEDHYLVKTDWLGAALVPELSSYNKGEVAVSSRHLPPQMTLPRDHFSLYPTYKSGYAFEVGTNATVYITALIVGPDNLPISLAAGTATYLGESSEGPVTIFTNKKGTLRSEGFKPGRYRLEVASGSFAPIEITIPESATENYDLGTIKLKAE